MANQNEIPKFIEDYKERKGKSTRRIDTGDVGLNLAYADAIDKSTTGEDGLIDYSLLKNPETQDSVVKATVKGMLGTAKRILSGVEIGADWTEFALTGVFGQTSDSIRQFVYQLKENAKLPEFRQAIYTPAMQQLRATSQSQAKVGLEREHVPQIVEFTGAPVDPEKMTLDDAVEVLDAHEDLANRSLAEVLKDRPYYMPETVAA